MSAGTTHSTHRALPFLTPGYGSAVRCPARSVRASGAPSGPLSLPVKAADVPGGGGGRPALGVASRLGRAVRAQRQGVLPRRAATRDERRERRVSEETRRV